MNPAPNTYHQTVSRRIQFQLYTQLELPGLGVVFDAPTDLQLSDMDIVQPDLIIVLQRNRHIVTPTKIKGIPDLVVEILSPASEVVDRVLKKELYRKSAIPEFWIVDPDEHAVDQFVLRQDAFQLLGRHAESVRLDVLSDVRVDLTRVW